MLIDDYLELPRAVVRKHFASVRGVGCEQDDLEAIGMVELWRSAEAWDGQGTFAWFAAQNIKWAILDALRDLRVVRRKRDRGKPCPEQVPMSVLPQPDPTCEDDQVERREVIAVVRDAVGRLPPRARAAMVARLTDQSCPSFRSQRIAFRELRLNPRLRALAS